MLAKSPSPSTVVTHRANTTTARVFHLCASQSIRACYFISNFLRSVNSAVEPFPCCIVYRHSKRSEGVTATRVKAHNVLVGGFLTSLALTTRLIAATMNETQ